MRVIKQGNGFGGAGWAVEGVAGYVGEKGVWGAWVKAGVVRQDIIKLETRMTGEGEGRRTGERWL